VEKIVKSRPLLFLRLREHSFFYPYRLCVGVDLQNFIEGGMMSEEIDVGRNSICREFCFQQLSHALVRGFQTAASLPYI